MYGVLRKFIFAFYFVFGYIGIEAIAQLEISAEIRPRTEFRNGFKSLNSKGEHPALFTEQRSRLNLGGIKRKE